MAVAQLVVVRRSEALPLRALGGIGPETPVAIAVCARATPAPLVLLGRRALVQRRSGGRSVGPMIPSFAGQWAPIFGSPPGAAVPLQRTAARLFAAQTGLTLPDVAKAEVRADPTDFETTRYVIAEVSEAALRDLAAGANAAIAANEPPEGVLAAVAAVTFPEAMARLGPVPPPANGWASFVVANVYGGVRPGALDVTFPMYVQILSTRTQTTSEAFGTALLLAAQTCADPEPAPSPTPRR